MAYRPYLGAGIAPPSLPPSPYFQDDEDEQSPTVRMAQARAGRSSGRYGFGGGQVDALADLDTTAQNGGRAKPLVSRYAGPAEVSDDHHDEDAGEPKSPYLVTGNASWTKAAPEAAGTEGFSTTPENRPPRSSAPIEKADLPRVNSEPAKSPSKWDAVRAKDEEIAKAEKKLSGWGMPWIAMAAPGVARLMTANLQGMRQDRDDLAREAAYFDDQKGAHQRFIEEERTKRANARAAAQVEAQKLKNSQDERHQAAIKNTGRVDENGRFVYIDPDTGAWREPAGIPGKTSPLDQDNPEAPAPKPYLPTFPKPKEAGAGSPHYETDDSGNVTAIYPDGTTKALGRKGKTTVHPEKPTPEDPKEKRIAGAYAAARSAFLRDHPDDEEGANNAARSAARDFSDFMAGNEGPGAGTRKNFKNSQTGALEPFELGKDGKWHKVVGEMTSSHGKK